MLAALLVVLLWIIRRHHSQVLLEEVLPRQKLEVSKTELECIRGLPFSSWRLVLLDSKLTYKYISYIFLGCRVE